MVLTAWKFFLMTDPNISCCTLKTSLLLCSSAEGEQRTIKPPRRPADCEIAALWRGRTHPLRPNNGAARVLSAETRCRF